MKDLGRTKFFLGLQIEYLNKGVFAHQLKFDQIRPSQSWLIVNQVDPDLFFILNNGKFHKLWNFDFLLFE